MSTRSGYLTVASPGQVGKALAGVGGHHFGVPEDHLRLAPGSVDVFTPRILADELLKPGDKYVATLDDWVDFLEFNGMPAGIASAIAQAFIESRKAGFALTLFGYIPLILTIPGKGSSMAFSPHGKIVAYGHFGPDQGTQWETWSASTSYDVVGPDVGAMPDVLPQGTLDAIRGAYATLITKPTGGGVAAFPGHTFLDGVAYYRAKADGNSTTGTWQRSAVTATTQGMGIASTPLQIATVVTLDALGARGGRFGRFYLPGLAQGYTGGVMDTQIAVQFVTAVRTCLTAVNTALTAAVEGDAELVVASGRGNGENRPVRQVRVGVVPDTMRSRRRSLDENYQSLPFQAV